MDAQIHNILLHKTVFPPYDKIQASHVCPTIEALLSKLDNDLIELERKVDPTWPKLAEQPEKTTDGLSVVWRIVNHLSSMKDSPELRAAIEEIHPKKVEFELRLRQSRAIYEGFKALRESSARESLSDARKRVVEREFT